MSLYFLYCVRCLVFFWFFFDEKRYLYGMPVKAINFTLFIPTWTRLCIAAQLINIESLNQLLVSGGYRGAGGHAPS